ncbi:phosphatase PAP2 family protein [bacterium]|nr:phosphatase PAP2 family protein [bacterium]
MWVALGLSVVCAALVWPARDRTTVRRGRGRFAPLFRGTGRHWRRNYGRRAFLRLGGALVAAGVLAYSGADEAIEGFHRRRVRSAGTDRAAHVLKFCGERFWFVNWLLVGAVDAWWRSTAFSRWGRANFEAMVVGLPTLWTVQRGLGANRPSSDDGSPRWRPLHAANSASGHTFMSAVPWLNLAARTGSVPVGAVARAASVLTGWSRLNDRKHYPSQILLGWVIAANAVDAVQGGSGRAPATTPGEGSETS